MTIGESRLQRQDVPTLRELPSPPPEKSGWPWTKASGQLPETMDDGAAWPKISIVTPSYNQGQFIEETIRSVLLQGYPNLEYIVIDGGSTDESVEIIERYAPWIDYWVSEADDGQSDAINKGFQKATGMYGSWINSDDMLASGALIEIVREVDLNSATIIYAGICNYMDEGKNITKKHQGDIHSLGDLINVGRVWRRQPHRGHIVQPETLFPIEMFRKVGGLDEDMPLAMDYDLWGRMLLEGAEIEYVDIEVCYFRIHNAQKTKSVRSSTKIMVEAAIRLTEQHPTWSGQQKKNAQRRLRQYRREEWRKTGRLSKMGLPESIVRYMRSVYAVFT